MKSYKSISNKHIFLKKKHFFLTLLGIIMSVALLTAMMTLMYSLVENIRINEIQNHGSYHLKIRAIDKDEALLITRRPEVEASGIVYYTDTASVGTYPHELSEYYGVNHKVIAISMCDKSSFAILPFQLEEGTYPENPGEIIIDRWFIRNYDGTAKVGSVISLPSIRPEAGGYTVTDTKDYLITGIIGSNDNITTGSMGRAASIYDPTSNPDSNVTAYVRIERGSRISVFKEKIKEIAGSVIFENNNSLISLEGRDGDLGIIAPVFSIGFFLAAIIAVATVAVVYNSFNISVLEKTSLYGLLRTSGATPRQIRTLVYREATFYAAIGIPPGVLIGLGVTFVLLEFVGFEPLNITGKGISTYISPWFVLLGSIIGILTVYISAYIPAVRAGRVSPVEAISGKKSISIGKPSRYNRKTLLGKIAGLPGAMAAKNLVRNKKSFRVTIFSIMLSSILFIVFNSLVVFSLDNNPYDSVGFDYFIRCNSDDYSFSKEDILHIKNIDGVEKVYADTEPEYIKSFNDAHLFYRSESDFNYPLLIASEESLAELSPNALIPSIYVDAADDSDLSYINGKLNEIIQDNPWYTLTDISEWERQNRKMTVQLYIFFYGFLAVIIMIGSLNIINTINTSLIQRRREFAVLGSVGMTRKQLSGMVIIETLIQGIKAGILGSAAGVLLVFILYRLFGRLFDMTEFGIPWTIVGITMGASIAISLLSCLTPMKKLRNQDIIATIRSLE